MIVKKEKLQAYLDKRGFTRIEFAARLGIALSEVDKMLSGETVGCDTAKKFIYFMKADRAQHYIDWSAIGTDNPLLKNKEDCEYDADEPLRPEEKLPIRNGSPVYRYGNYIGDCVICKEDNE